MVTCRLNYVESFSVILIVMAICLHMLFSSPEYLYHAVINSYAYGSDLIVHLIKIEERGHAVMLGFPGRTQGFKLRADKLAWYGACFNFVTRT